MGALNVSKQERAMTKVLSRFLVVLMLMFAITGDMATPAFAAPLRPIIRAMRHVEVPLGGFRRPLEKFQFEGTCSLACEAHRFVDPWLEIPIRPARPVDPLWEK